MSLFNFWKRKKEVKIEEVDNIKMSENSKELEKSEIIDSKYAMNNITVFQPCQYMR